MENIIRPPISQMAAMMEVYPATWMSPSHQRSTLMATITKATSAQNMPVPATMRSGFSE